FDLGIGFFSDHNNAFDNTHIVNNHIIVAKDVATAGDTFQNIGIHVSFGTNIVIQNNVIDLRGDSVSDSGSGNFASNVGLQSNTGGGNTYEGLLIDSNTINVYGAQAADPCVVLGIWENGFSHSSNITVSNNQFINHDPGNDPNLNLQ